MLMPGVNAEDWWFLDSLLFWNLQSDWEDWWEIQAAYKALEGSTLEWVWKFNMPQN